MNNKAFDLNLVRIFCTVYDTGSLTIAGERLNITQPAISHALKKMRAYYDDPLFVRSDGKMIPTKLSTSIAPNLKKSLELINISLKSKMVLNAEGSSKKTFKISMSDMSQIFFIPSLCMALENILDKIKLDIVQITQDKIEPIMRAGELDFALGNLPYLSGNNINGRVLKETLFFDKFICMVRDGHPSIKSSLDKIDISKIKLLNINSSITGHTGLLEEINSKYEKNIALTIPNFTVAPEIISKTDFGVIIPKSVAKRYNMEKTFILHDIDLDNNRIEINIYYHMLYKDDPSINWMKEIFIEHFRENQP